MAHRDDGGELAVRPYADNVHIELEPLPTKSPSGLLHIPQQSRQGARGHRYALVVASGPGHWRQVSAGAKGTRDTVFVPNETRPGDRVVVDAQCGTAWEGELSVPRHNPGGDFGDVRIVRESEILAILETDGPRQP